MCMCMCVLLCLQQWFCTRAILSSRGQWAIPGDIFCCYNLRGEVLPASRGCWHLVGRGQGCCYTPCNAQGSSHDKALCSSNVSTAPQHTAQSFPRVYNGGSTQLQLEAPSNCLDLCSLLGDQFFKADSVSPVRWKRSH